MNVCINIIVVVISICIFISSSSSSITIPSSLLASTIAAPLSSPLPPYPPPTTIIKYRKLSKQHKHLSTANCIICKTNAMLNFGRDAEILEEALMCRPELTPHRLAHTMLSVNQVGSSFKLLTRFHPLHIQTTPSNIDNVTVEKQL